MASSACIPAKVLSTAVGVIPLITSNDSAGPIGRNVKDVATLLGVIDTKDTDYVAGLEAQALNGVKAAFLKADVLAQPTSPIGRHGGQCGHRAVD